MRRVVEGAYWSGVEQEEWNGERIAYQSAQSRAAWSKKSRSKKSAQNKEGRAEGRTVREKC